MDNIFEIGEVVVCVDANVVWYKLGRLQENEMYTVEGFNPYDGGLVLKEVKSPRSGKHAYKAGRFRRVDYNFAERIMREMVMPKEYELDAPRFELNAL